MTNPKILILGHGRHGKDTVAEMIRDHYGLSFISSSWFAADRVMMPYFTSIGQPYADVETCYADRHNHRATWYQAILRYNEIGDLTKEILRDYDIYVGMRSSRDFAEAKSLFDHILWIEDPRKPKEGRDSFDIDRTDDMILILNDGTLEDLLIKVHEFAHQYVGEFA